jgi:hypothetical protein
MADRRKDGPDEEQDEIRSAIAAFEQILEAMPDDRGSLEALYHAYERLGDEKQSTRYLVRLGNVLLDENDVESAKELLDALENRSWDSEAEELAGRIESAGKPSGEGEEEAQPEEAEEAPAPEEKEEVSYNFNMADELAFAWSLLEAGQLDQEEYASVVQDLTEMSASEGISTVSLLHVLEHRNFKNLENVVVKASQDTGTPVISLSGFDIPHDAGSLLPMDFMLRRGALIFGFIGNELMVAIMNPYSTRVHKDVGRITGRKCHFFTCMPSEFDTALDNMMQVRAEAEESSE